MFTLVPSKSKSEQDKTHGKFQVLKDGTKYCKLMKNGTTRQSIMTGGLELWLTEDEANKAITLYQEGQDG